MITLKSSETDKKMILTIKDHAPLKKIYTAAVQNKHEKLIYKRLGESIVAYTGKIFEALIELDKEIFKSKERQNAKSRP